MDYIIFLTSCQGRREREETQRYPDFLSRQFETPGLMKRGYRFAKKLDPAFLELDPCWGQKVTISQPLLHRF